MKFFNKKMIQIMKAGVFQRRKKVNKASCAFGAANGAGPAFQGNGHFAKRIDSLTHRKRQ